MTPDEPQEEVAAATDSPAPAIAQPVKYYASRRIEHDGKTIIAGDPIPADFPLDSLKRLITARHVAKAPPGETTITRTPGKPT